MSSTVRKLPIKNKKKAAAATAAFSQAEALAMYQALLRPRVIEEQMLLSLRKGLISKWFSGIGQEAISVGATLAMEPEEWILTLHRNLGVFTAREVPVSRLIAQFQGAVDGFTKGRDRSFHFGAPEFHIAGMISHLGPQMTIADGIGLAEKLSGSQRAALVFCGDGATSEGDFHESLNVAAVWDLPVVFVIENNGYGLSTPVNEQYRCSSLVDRAAGYGMAGRSIDGNDIFTVVENLRQILTEVRAHSQPFLLECRTFRMRGHEEASGVKYVPPALFEEWAKRDPLLLCEQSLLSLYDVRQDTLLDLRTAIETEVRAAIAEGFRSPAVQFDLDTETADLFAATPASHRQHPRGTTTEKRFVDALADAHHQAMDHFPKLVLMGQDIAEYGGVFKVTEGLSEKFGKERVRNTPLCESAILGAGLGLALCGYKSVIEMQFADFVSSGFTQVVNNLAKLHYRWGAQADVVVRLPCGAGVGAGPFHSQSPEAWFTHCPGLKVVYPSNPHDAKGLLLRSIADPNPVLFFEHKFLYRSAKGAVPDEYYEIEFGQARCVREGSQFAIITYGAGVLWALEYAAAHPEHDPYILDLRTLCPLDYDAIVATVQDLGRVIVLHEAHLTGGFGGEIAAWIGEHCFDALDAPVLRVAGLDIPVPFAAALEQNFLPQKRLPAAVERLLAY
jgi:2-oxoisovalerate dehydrogenase E1 component